MNKRYSAVAASCFVFMCGNAARANMIPFDPADLKKDSRRERSKGEQPQGKDQQDQKSDGGKDEDKSKDNQH